MKIDRESVINNSQTKNNPGMPSSAVYMYADVDL